MSSLQWWHRGTDSSAAGRDAGAEAPTRGPFSLHTTVLQPHRWVLSCTHTSMLEPAGFLLLTGVVGDVADLSGVTACS